ncbi:hypothetical protein [Bacteroides uniformis]|uniref:hypothetical protein n=1 Tax=Bacteroides uniformis TaxID=820 RepID=UPI0011C220F3|nr:hypothetical protein [Bacteroides uniformis]
MSILFDKIFAKNVQKYSIERRRMVMRKVMTFLKEAAIVVKEQPGVCFAILVLGFALGAMHSWFGL